MKNEREISLKGLVIYILQHWRSIIIGIIIGGLLLLGFGFYKERSSASSAALPDDIQTPEQVLEEMLAAEAEEDAVPISELDKSTAATAYLSMSNYYEGVDYMNRTPYMQINGAFAPQTTISVSLLPSINDKNSAIVYSLKQLLLGGDLHSYVNSKAGTNIENWERLISVSDNISTEVPSVNGVFTITVIYIDEQGCRDITDSIISFINEKQPELAALYGDFDLNIINNGTELVYSNTILNAQRDKKTSVQNYYSTAINAMSSFTKKQLDYYDSLLDSASFDAADQKALVKSLRDFIEEDRELKHQEAMLKAQTAIDAALEKAASSSLNKKKYVLIGLLLGAFVMVVIHACRYIFANRTDLYDDVQNIYGIADLGHIPADKPKKKIFSFVDKWILKWRNRAFRQGRHEAIGVSAAGINMLAEKNQLNNIAIVSCGREWTGMEPADSVIANIGELTSNSVVLENVLDDPVAMNKMASADGVVIITRTGKTFRSEVARLADLITRQGIKMLGAVTVD